MAQIGLEALAEFQSEAVPHVEFRCIDRHVLGAWIDQAVALGFKENSEPETFCSHLA